MTEYSPAKTGEYQRIFPNFQNCACCEKDLKNNKDNSRHLGRKHARIFVLGHYLFLVAHSFPRASLSENCSLLGTDTRNVRGQISEHIFAPNKDNSRHLGRKYAWIFVLGHYLFLVAHSFPRASLSENCSLLRTDNVHRQISKHIFVPNGDYCLYMLDTFYMYLSGFFLLV